MRNRTRGAFTLVELLVVITIIGMLMALLFPALGAFLARMDILTCTNRQAEIAKTLVQYQNKKERYPGYVTKVMIGSGDSARQPVLKSWVVATLELIQLEDFKAITRGAGPQPTFLKLFNCPSSKNNGTGDSLDYVANCGRKDAAAGAGNIPPDWKANGIFMKESLRQSSQRDEIVTFNDLNDGPSRTLLISENLQATQWGRMTEQDVGMVWFAEVDPQPETKRINNGFEVEIATGDYNYARPSSNHPDGVVVAFCDGRTMFLSDKVEYAAVYCKLMTPNGKEAKEPGQKALVAEVFRLPLNEELMTP